MGVTGAHFSVGTVPISGRGARQSAITPPLATAVHAQPESNLAEPPPPSEAPDAEITEKSTNEGISAFRRRHRTFDHWRAAILRATPRFADLNRLSQKYEYRGLLRQDKHRT
jgi:hypothetical protein